MYKNDFHFHTNYVCARLRAKRTVHVCVCMCVCARTIISSQVTRIGQLIFISQSNIKQVLIRYDICSSLTITVSVEASKRCNESSTFQVQLSSPNLDQLAHFVKLLSLEITTAAI